MTRINDEIFVISNGQGEVLNIGNGLPRSIKIIMQVNFYLSGQ